MLLQKTTSRQFISQASLFNSRLKPFLLFFNIIFQYVFIFHLIFFKPLNLIFFKEVLFYFITFFQRNFIILLSLIYLILISLNHHNLTNIFIHAVI